MANDNCNKRRTLPELPRLRNQETFLFCVKQVFGDKFDLSEFQYRKSHIPGTIICPEHGRFEAKPTAFLRNTEGCTQCSRGSFTISQSIDITEAMRRLQASQNGKILLIDEASYKKYSSKCTFQCVDCKYEFTKPFNEVVLSKRGCPSCFFERPKHRATKVGNNGNRVDEYDYKHLAFTRGYEWMGINTPENSMTNTEWRCKKCNHQWSARYNTIKTGCGCPKCSRGKNAMSKEEFSERFHAINGDSLLFDQFAGMQKKIDVFCLACGFMWNPKGCDAVRGIRCYKCSNDNTGELAIRKFLDENFPNRYDEQKRFDTCVGSRGVKLPFDFLAHPSTLIEMDGEQHRRPVSYWGGEAAFKRRQELDSIKNQWAANNGYKLIRIPYWDRGRIPEILTEHLLA